MKLHAKLQSKDVKVKNSLIYLAVKIKFALQQAMDAQRCSRGIALLFL
jgi:hypothetical protein